MYPLSLRCSCHQMACSSVSVTTKVLVSPDSLFKGHPLPQRCSCHLIAGLRITVIVQMLLSPDSLFKGIWYHTGARVSRFNDILVRDSVGGRVTR